MNSNQTELVDFSRDCENCQTLVVRNRPAAERFNVSDAASDFYGRSYYGRFRRDGPGTESLAGEIRDAYLWRPDFHRQDRNGACWKADREMLENVEM